MTPLFLSCKLPAEVYTSSSAYFICTICSKQPLWSRSDMTWNNPILFFHLSPSFQIQSKTSSEIFILPLREISLAGSSYPGHHTSYILHWWQSSNLTRLHTFTNSTILNNFWSWIRILFLIHPIYTPDTSHHWWMVPTIHQSPLHMFRSQQRWRLISDHDGLPLLQYPQNWSTF